MKQEEIIAGNRLNAEFAGIKNSKPRPENIIIFYWHGKIPGCKYEHNETHPYSEKRRNTIINYLLSIGLSVMIRELKSESGTNLYINIDNGRFGQR